MSQAPEEATVRDRVEQRPAFSPGKLKDISVRGSSPSASWPAH